MNREIEEMRIYSDAKKFIQDKRKEYSKDTLNYSKEFQMFCRLEQMYNELYQLKLSYQKVLEEDFKEKMIRTMIQAKQTLYNTCHHNSRKQDLIDGINFAIKQLNEILVLENKEENNE